MTRRSDSLDKMARFVRFSVVAVAGALLLLASAAAQQDRAGRSDRSSGRDDSQSSDQSGQYEQRRRAESQNADRGSQERGQRARNQQDQSDTSQFSDRAQRQPAGSERYGRQGADRGQFDQERQASRVDQSRDQGGRGGSLRQRLGLSFGQQQQGQSGLIINDVQQGSAAAQAGLRAGDQITAVDGRSINGQQQFFAYLSGQSGRQIPLTVYRNGRQINLQLAPEQGGGDVAWLGVFLQDSESNQEGAQITQIYPGGPAARAGLRAGDIVTSVNNQHVSSSADLISAIEEEQPGSRAELAVTRNNQQMNLPVTLGSRESFTWTGHREDQWSGQGGGQYAGSQQGGQSGQSSGGQHDYFSNLPPFAMQLEHERRMYEQHQRIETEIAKLQDEVRQLREALQRR